MCTSCLPRGREASTGGEGARAFAFRAVATGMIRNEGDIDCFTQFGTKSCLYAMLGE